MFYVELPPNIRDHKNTGKKMRKILYFVSILDIQSDISKLYKTILCQKISANSYLYQYSYLQGAMWEKSLGFCGCLTLVMMLFVSHGTIRTWDILLLLQRSLLSPFSR